MNRVCVQGVVRNGQVVLDEPLGLPDGTAVTVADSTPDDTHKRTLLTALNRLDLMDDPDWQVKAAPERIALVEAIVRDATALAEGRQEGSSPDSDAPTQRAA